MDNSIFLNKKTKTFILTEIPLYNFLHGFINDNSTFVFLNISDTVDLKIIFLDKNTLILSHYLHKWLPDSSKAYSRRADSRLAPSQWETLLQK